MLRSARLLALTLFALPALGHAAEDMVWVEGEDAGTKTVTRHNWYSDAVKKDQLSGGDGVSNFGGADGLARYDVTIPKDGDYTLWVRANVIGAALAYQVAGGAWTEIDTRKAVDVVNIANDGKPDMRIIGWLNAGKLTLKGGRTALTFKMHSGNNHHGGIDCFVLTLKPFTPNGTVKPGQKLGTADAGWWAFEPDADAFTRDALLDLRDLNEKVAGESGFITAVGDDFKLGNGKTVRFWALNTGHGLLDADDAAIADTAARWAKLGHNLVRVHGGFFDRDGDDPTRIDEHHLQRFLHVVQAFKKKGIYTYLSHYFPLWMQLKPSDGIAGCAVGKNPMALLYFEPRMQEIYRAWVKKILTTASTETGKALVDEPALADFEIINEDSLFFWTFNEQAIGTGPWPPSRGSTRRG